MLQPVPSGSSLVHLSPLRPPGGGRPASVQDGYEASAPEPLAIYGPGQTGEKPLTPPTESLWQRAVLGSCLAVAGVGGALAFVPGAAAAQVQVAPARPVKDPVIRQLLASSLVTGRQPTGSVPQRVAQLKPAVRQELEGLPVQAQEAYVKLDTPARKWLSTQINGSSSTPFGKVQHRKAFIKGRVAIFNIFDLIKSKIGEQVKSGTVPGHAQPRINAYLDSLKELEPSHREALADALQAEWSATRPA